MRHYTDGNGTVRKHRGKWQGVVSYRDINLDGEPISGWKSVTKVFEIKSYSDSNRGKREAERALKEWRTELDAAEEAAAKAEKMAAASGGIVSAESTVSEWLDYHIEHQIPAERTLEASTLDGYRRLARYMNKRIGDIKLCDLKRAQVEQLRNDMRQSYAESTVHGSLRLLKSALDAAVKGGLIDDNPAKDVKAPIPRQPSPNYLDVEERARLINDLRETLDDACPPNRAGESKAFALAIELALMTGMREGEICGLRWQDVDFGRSQIIVRGAIGMDANGYYEKDPKSHHARPVPLVDENLKLDLEARKETMTAACAELGITLNPRIYVLGGIDGSYMQPRLLYRAWCRRADRLGLVGTDGTRPSFHDLRHTFGTALAHANVPESSLKSIMGHASIDTTHRYYVGLDNEADRRAMAAASAALHGQQDTATG